MDLPQRAHDFGMTLVPDQQDMAAGTVMRDYFCMNFGDKRAGGVQRTQSALPRVTQNRLGNAVR